VLVLVGGLVLAGNWASYHAPGRNDQYQLIQLGQCVYNGGRMYVDCWENKPPGIAWLNALGFVAARGNPIGPWIVPAVLEVGMLVLVWAALRRIVCERTARKAVLLSAVVYALRIYDTPSINPDFYSSIFELAAIACLIRGVVAPLNRSAVDDSEVRCTYSYPLCALAGLLWAAATSVKQVGCVGLLVLTLGGIITALLRPELRPHVIKAVSFTWTGFLLGIATVAGVLWYQGTLREAWNAIFTFNTGLVSAQSFAAAIDNRRRLLSELAPVVLPLWLAITGVIMSFWYPRFRGFPLSLAIGLVMWWLAAVILAGMGPSHSMRYWQATFPPMLALATVGLYYIQKVQDGLVRPERLTAFVVAATAAVLLARPAIYELRAGLATSIAAASEHPTEREQLVEISGRVSELSGQSEPIYVLDYRPGIYVYSDHPVASRFNYPRSASQWNEILARLEATPAKIIIKPDKPASEFRHYCDSACQLRVEAVLNNCEMVDKIQDYEIHECRDSAPTAADSK
jgi:hypothetical protein